CTNSGRSSVPFLQMCLTMDGMSIFIVKHICRRDTFDHSAAADSVLINQDFYRADVAAKIACVRVGFGKLCRSYLCIMLCRRWAAMTKPLLQFKQRHRLFGIVEL